MASDLKNLLAEFGLAPAETDVYLAATRLGEATVTEIGHNAKLPRTTTASILERLRQYGLVTRHKNRNKGIYWVEDPLVLVEKEKAKLLVAEQLRSRLSLQYHRDDKKPNVEIYDSRASIINLINKFLGESPKGSEILTWDAPVAKNYIKVMSEDLFKTLSDRKVSKGIQTRSLIPQGQEYLVNKAMLSSAINVRILPQGLVFDTSIWLYGNSLVLFSGNQTFAIKITNKNIKESIQSIFNFLWNLSTPLR